MFLLDTVVLSELRKRERNPGLVAWIAGQRTADQFVSVITIGEIQRASSADQANRHPPDYAVSSIR